MSRAHRRSRLSLPLALALAAAACGGHKQADEADDAPAEQAAAEQPPAQQPAQPAADQPFVLTSADLSAYERGIEKENDMLRAAVEKMKKAGGGTDTLETLFSVLPEQTETEGAKVAGMPLDRYREVEQAVNDVLGTKEMQGAVAKEMKDAEQVDTTEMDSATRAGMREGLRQMQSAFNDPYAKLTPEAKEAFQAHEQKLAALRAENMRLLMTVGGRGQ